jgi:hypothetical protein
MEWADHKPVAVMMMLMMMNTRTKLLGNQWLWGCFCCCC